MKKLPIEAMTAEQLVDRFSQLTFAQDDTLWISDARRYNMLHKQIEPVVEELRRRGELERIACLLNNVNITVRLETARRLLRILPEEVRPVLEEIQKSKSYPWAGDAGMLLDSNVFRNALTSTLDTRAK